MRTKSIVTLLGVVAVMRAARGAATDQSQPGAAELQPTAAGDAGVSRRDTPEVVLQLKYTEGELNKIYLTQFRKEAGGWEPPVLARRSLCADLCYSGLGGESCGSGCEEMLPVGLQTALRNATAAEGAYGEPRVEVCPVLCRNGLGQPLCNCAENEPEPTDWSAVCGTFCATDNYVLRGCPACSRPAGDAPTSALKASLSASRSLNTAEGWRSWCNVQCRQGQGGAACNCDAAPF